MKSQISRKALAAGLAVLVSGVAIAEGVVKVDAGIAGYKRASGVTGNLNSIGSDTLNNLMTFWAEGFKKAYPNVNIQIEGKGSTTAPPALIEGTAQLGPMSREMKGAEIDKFEAKYGYKPTKVRVALDGIAVYVNKDNPLEKLSLKQVDAIFSATRKRGGKDAKTWGDLGLTGEWAKKPISIYGRNSASGTYGYFKEIALSGGDYRSNVKEQPGSSSVVQGIAETFASFGIGYTTPVISQARRPTAARFRRELRERSKKYPSRLPTQEGARLDPLVGEYLKYILSAGFVVKDGYSSPPRSSRKSSRSSRSRRNGRGGAEVVSTRASVKIADRLARWVITGGGLLMVGALVLMFVLILLEAIPLWAQPKTKLEAETKLDAAWQVLAAGENEYRELTDLACADGSVRVIDLHTGKTIQELRPEGAEGLAFTSATRTLTGEYALGLPNGSVLLADGRFTSTFDPATSARVTTYRLSSGAKVALDAAGRPLTSVAGRTRESGLAVVAGSPEPGVLLAATYSEDDGAQIFDLSEKLAGEKVAVIALDDRAELLAAGTASGKVLFFSFLNRTPEAVGEATLPVSDPAPITAARYLSGARRSSPDAKGRLVGIQRIRRTPDAEDASPPSSSGSSPRGAITALAASARSKTFLPRMRATSYAFRDERANAHEGEAAGSTVAAAIAVAIHPRPGYLAILPGGLATVAPSRDVAPRALRKVHYEG
jgi:phosphate transport system substrate-binding protein